MTKRPPLNKSIAVDDFRDFYWLKKELTDFCREVGLPTSGGKIEIANRIAEYLETGKVPEKKRGKSTAKSTFDWSNAPLTVETLITDNYKNTQHTRAFFKEQIGKSFSFNTVFMDWMKQNAGKTLKEAIDTWHKINAQKKDKNFKTTIAPQFEYNTYIRAFMADNPKLTKKEAIKYWKLKRDKRGHNRYEASDLKL